MVVFKSNIYINIRYIFLIPYKLNYYNIVFFAALNRREEDFSNRLDELNAGKRNSFHKFTALHYAVLVDDYPAVKLLIKCGCNPNLLSTSGHKAIDLSADGPIKEMLSKYMIEVIVLL